MEKLLIYLEVPVITTGFDVYIPRFLNIGEVISLLARAVEDISNNVYISSGKEFLCLKEKNTVLNPDLALENYDIKNGDKLVLL